MSADAPAPSDNSVVPPVEEEHRIGEPKSPFWRFLSRPEVQFLTFLGSVASLLSIGLAIYFYTKSKEYPELTYYVYPVKAAVLQTGQASKLAATFDDKPVLSDITVAQVAFWNEGRRAVKRTEVLKPIVIYTENNTPILEATIRKNSRNVTQLSLNTDELQRGRVTLNWTILEQNDGGLIQLIYAGNTQVRIQAEGVVEGQPNLKLVEFTGTIKTPYEQYESERRKSYASYFFVAGFLLILSSIAVRTVKANHLLELKEGYSRLRESYEGRMHSYDDSLKWYRSQLKYNEDSITQYKELSLPSDFVKEIIQQHEKALETCKTAIQENLNEQTELKGQQVKLQEQERGVSTSQFDIAFVILILLALISLSLGFYSLFVLLSQGPPFAL